VRNDPRLLLRGFGKFVGVVLAAGVAGALIGIGLAQVSGDDAPGDPVAPATTSTTTRASTSAGATQTASTATTAATPGKPVYRIPRVDVLSARLGAAAPDGRAQVSVRVRFTNRGNRAVTIKTPALLSAQDEVPLASDARDAAGPLLRSIAPGKSATGTLRFDVVSNIAQRLAATPAARLRIGNRTVTVKLATDQTAG
jgi:hypothetical protein